MAEFTKKHPDIVRLMKTASENMGGCGERTEGKCTMCPRKFDPATEFDGALSKKEYSISGMCQKCQNNTFGDPHE